MPYKFSSDQLLGPFIFLEHLTYEMYLHFLQEQLSQLLEDVPLARNFQHDGATVHFNRAVTAHLDQHFKQRWVGRGGPITWPPRSIDLITL
ncbi:hypothetical protein ANN_09464 [Periplaneta americana]|uniref:Histone-lysine N-methyltransferase SETMAR n=1 Tax=Periplaneta americana TaxID=6978 RepID=A0ABQ8TN52_PERAM|nr:hypothetical protein ANN_09464 [Periplaneta americana]